jgi:diguanylate cyclase (GGDEF)-like protein
MRLLIVQDDARPAAALTSALRSMDRNYEVTHVRRLTTALRRLEADRLFDFALVNLGLRDAQHLQAVSRLRAVRPELVIVAVTNDPDPKAALDAIRVGAQDAIPEDEVSPRLVDRVLRCAFERHRRELRLTDAAYHDDLTGVLNRRGIRQALAATVGSVLTRKSRSCALMSLDLNDFKLVNDRHGHPVGDELLVLCCRRLEGCLRSNDHIGRLGGDEFAVILESVFRPREVSTIANKVLAVLDEPFQIGRYRISVSVSIGIAICPFDAVDAKQMVARADKALYEAKRGIKGGHVSYSDIAPLPGAQTLMHSQTLCSTLSKQT